MQRVFVLNHDKSPLMPCHPARARKLLRQGRAKVYRYQPFTLILTVQLIEPVNQIVELKVDPGSKITGISIVALFKQGWVLLWAANLHHRGQAIKRQLDKRRIIRRVRRQRKTRYRQPRFSNRTRPRGWLPPSLQSRVDNIKVWASRLTKAMPVASIEVETVRFDMQKIDNPEITGMAYQQGELVGYEVREYLLEKFNRTCVYCGQRDIPLQIEHIIPKSKGGSNRISNLALACCECNKAKGKQSVQQFLSHKPAILKRLLVQLKQPLKDAAAVNATRYAIGNAVKSLGLPVQFWSGGRTKYNRFRQGYAKDHWLDATCVGENGSQVKIAKTFNPLTIKATGRGRRQLCLVNKHGFPRTKAKQFKRVNGFQTGDLVRAIVPRGKKAGCYVGRVAIRGSGSFRVGNVDSISWKYCSLRQRADGYEYN